MLVRKAANKTALGVCKAALKLFLSYVEECAHLSKDEQRQLLKLLQKFEILIDGTLGTWKTDPVDLELKDSKVKPYHAKPYPMPYSQEKKNQRRD